MIIGGVLERYPRLQIVSAEHDVAWISFFLYRIDKYAARGVSTIKLPMKPSDYVKRQVYATFINDPVFMNVLEFIGRTTLCGRPITRTARRLFRAHRIM